MKKLLTKTGTSFLLGSAFMIGAITFAAATIPVACSTPGTCTNITSTFQAVASKTSMKFLDADSSNFVEIKSPATVTSDVTLTLPNTAGNNGETLVTNGSGVLSWQLSPSDRFLGMISFMVPNITQHIWEINGQTVTDSKLAAYITANPITGFSVNGNNVTLPDWRGRYLGASGIKGISNIAGEVLADATSKNGLTLAASGSHKHNLHYTDGGAGAGLLPTAQDAIGYQYNSQRYIPGREDMDSAGNHSHSLTSSDLYTRPETVGMPMVIIGGSL